jgi:hypothetical protein
MLSSIEMRDQGPSWQQETERVAKSDAVHRRSEAELMWRSLRTRSVRIVGPCDGRGWPPGNCERRAARARLCAFTLGASGDFIEEDR